MPLRLPWPSLTSVVDILLVAFLVYQIIQILRGRRAAHILSGVFILVLVYVFAAWAQLELLRSILANMAPYTAFALIVMFQSEIRRMLARIGRRNWVTFGSRLQKREAMEEVLLAVKQLSQEKTGALIVVEREMGLRTFVESGVLLDAQLSRDLLLCIFQKGNSLHDGAVILQGDRIVAAACFLPLTMDPVSRRYGTRHRAALGIAEDSDCVAIVVSEESGRISIAQGRELKPVEDEQLRERFAVAFGVKESLPTAELKPPEHRRHVDAEAGEL